MEGLIGTLWNDLIFKHLAGDTPSMLSARAVCRFFRALLNNSRHWDFSLFYRLRCDERARWWHGVQLGMAREARTLANCAAGKYTTIGTGTEMIAGRVVILNTQGPVSVNGIVICESNVGHENFTYRDHVMADRWLVYRKCVYQQGEWIYSFRMYDCLLLADVPLFDVVYGEMRVVISGYVLAYQTHRHTIIMRMDPSLGCMFEVSRIPLACDIHTHFSLCCNGKYYVTLKMPHDDTIFMHDVDTGHIVRTISEYGFVFGRIVVCGDVYINALASAYANKRRDSSYRQKLHIVFNATVEKTKCEIDQNDILSVHRTNGVTSAVISKDAFSNYHCVVDMTSGKQTSTDFVGFAMDHSGACAFRTTDYTLALSVNIYNLSLMKPIPISLDRYDGKHIAFTYGVLCYRDRNGTKQLIRFDE